MQSICIIKYLLNTLYISDENDVHLCGCICSSPIFCLLPSGLSTGPVSTSLSFSSSPHCLLNPPTQMSCPPMFDPHTHPLRIRHHYGGGFSLAEVHQELQTLQRQLANSERALECVVLRMTNTNSLNISTLNEFEIVFCSETHLCA